MRKQIAKFYLKDYDMRIHIYVGRLNLTGLLTLFDPSHYIKYLN